VNGNGCWADDPERSLLVARQIILPFVQIGEARQLRT